MLVLLGAREAGCFRQVAALYSDRYRQVPLYMKCLDQGRLAALDRWLHYTVTTIDRFHCLDQGRLTALDRWLHYTETTIDRFHCTSNVWTREAGCFRQVAALYSDHYRQVPLYIKCLDQGRLAALDRWLHYTATTIDRFHCTQSFPKIGAVVT